MHKLYELRILTGMRKSVWLIGSLTVITVSCNKLPFHDHFTEVVYVESNNYLKGDNAIIAYRNNGDGKLMPVAGGPFFTGGSGIGNPQQIEGPNNSDNEIRITNDKQFLLAVNSGSNTIAVFKINIDGTLSPVPGSPFPSCGETPVSIDMWQQYVYVANKSQNPITPTTTRPNYTVFKMEGDGSLTPVDTMETIPGSSPATILVSKNYGLVYTSWYLGLRVSGPPHFVYNTFTTSNTGILTSRALSSSYSARPQGIWESPSANIVYAASSKGTKGGLIDLFAINPHPDLGAPYYPDLTGYVKAGAGACCVRTNTTGDHLYVLNADENSVSVYNSSNAASPDSLQKLPLKNAGPTYDIYGTGTYISTSSGCMSMSLSSNGKFLYVVSQHTNPDFNVGNYNYLHVLSVNPDGTLEEQEEPIQLPVQNTVRPRGVAVYRVN
jgi:6-phosphogluconolactonase (cycloisomerase 2 family)